MSYIPLRDRCAGDSLAPRSSGATLDSPSLPVHPARPASPDSDELLRRARTARSAAVGVALVRLGRFLAVLLAAPARSLIVRLVARRRRGRAAAELRAVDERTLADIGLRRSDIPFIVAQGGRAGALERRP
jgi:uncharacterized protein YjiS (DUF1127 family)